MRVETAGRTRAFLFAAAIVVAAATNAFAQGSVTGRVTTKDGSQPLSDARVTVIGSSISAHSNADGRFRLAAVPAGAVTIRVNRLGYVETKQVVTVTNGADVAVAFALTEAVQQLPDVVTTATGQERRVEVGNSIAAIDAADRVRETPIHSIGELLVAKAPGVTVLPNNMSGGAPTVRIRGLNSLSRGNGPIYVVDGIRIDNGTGNLSTGGTQSSRVNDINPEEIENVELVRGPSATTLYGTDAANGVIVITTKKGRSGGARWNYSSEFGRIEDHNPYDKTWAIWGHNPTTLALLQCQLITIADKTCVQDSLTSAHMLRRPGFTPIGDGNRQLHTLQLTGGTDLVRYFASGTYERENGPIQMPQTDKLFLTSQKIAVRDEWEHPEWLERGSFRTNLNAAVTPTFDLSVTTMFARSEQRLPQVDNNVNSFYYNGLTNPGYYPGANCTAATPCLGNYTNVNSSTGQVLNGWAQFTPAMILQRQTTEGVKRFVGGTTISWRPLSWMQNDGTVGIDFGSQRNFNICRLNECPNFGTQRLGSVTDNHNNTRVLTANLRSTGTYRYADWGVFRTTLGGDYINNQADGSNANSSQLPPGGQTVGSGAVAGASNTLPTATKTLGYYIQEQFAYRDRLFLTGAVRSDQNTAFGTKYGGVWYPKLQVSWVASDEAFFPRIDFINTLRLRSAYGSSGVQPGPTTALKTLQVSTVSLFSDQAALLASAIGNPNLKPELTSEFEGGIDIDAWNNKIRLETTYYSKTTTDALVGVNIATSSGAAVGSVTKNLGKVKNAGFEASMTVQALDLREIAWDFTIAGSHNSNRVIALGLDDAGKPIPTIGTTTRTQPGYPINSFFQVAYNYRDVNGDGLISAREVTVNALDTTYLGPAFAPNQATVATGIDLLNRKVRINASFDHRGGHMLLENTRGFLCVQTLTCIEKSNASTPIDLQARTVAANYTSTRTSKGFYEKGDFWRFRELSLTADVPQQYVRRYLRAENVSVVLGARNLKVWSDYLGEDPEANYGTGDVPSDLLTTGPRRYYTLRLNVQF